MKKMSILALAAATLFGTLYADEEPVKDEPVATTDSTEETEEGTSVSFNDGEEEGEVKADSFLAANDDEEKPVEDERIA
ncbi:MAG: hypothetical protein H7A38_06615 [Chlamydiales bacterium]|nr:hypothetical protein [Chlamydiales bacterium]